jgi:DNA repair protein RecO (recombination protein O)
MQALKVLRHYQRSSYEQARRLHLTPAQNRQVEALMQHYLTYLLEQKLNTPPFLRMARGIIWRIFTTANHEQSTSNPGN